MKKSISIYDLAGEFAENKDTAKAIRINIIMPTLSDGGEVVLDFDGVAGATQSFIHALISDPIRKFRGVAFDNLYYENTNNDIKQVVSIVYRYMQESLD